MCLSMILIVFGVLYGWFAYNEFMLVSFYHCIDKPAVVFDIVVSFSCLFVGLVVLFKYGIT